MISVRLERYTKIVDWDYGYLVVMAKYKGLDEVEEYIDLTESSKSPASTANIRLTRKNYSLVKRKYLMSFLKECSKYKGLQTRKAVFVTIL